MKLSSYFNKDAIIVSLKSKTKVAAIREIAKKLADSGYTNNLPGLVEDLLAREKQVSTAIGSEVAVPHAQSEWITKPVVAIAKTKNPISWGTKEQKEEVKLIFMIGLPKSEASAQIDILQGLSAMIMDEPTRKAMLHEKKPEEIVNLIESFTASEEKKNSENSETKQGAYDIVAVTACPTGIAHTYLAADSLKKAAKELNLAIKVETQGRSVDNPLSVQEINDAKAIILAIDRNIDGMDRFNGKTAYQIGAKKAIHNAKEAIEKALAGEGKVVAVASEKQTSTGGVGQGMSWGNFKNVYRNLMGGVSRMLPFVVAGGILLGIGFLLDSGITGNNFGVTREVSRWFAGLGKLAFGIFVPVLGGFVAYSIVGIEGLLPGFLAGLIANGGGLLYSERVDGMVVSAGWANLWGGLTPSVEQSVLVNGSGFIGAMVGGYVAAACVMVLRTYVFAKAKPVFSGVISIIGVPFFSALMIGGFMFAAQIPLAYFQYGLKLGLVGLRDNNLSVLLGIVIGIMSATDFGGPINKVAYTFGTGLLAGGGPAEFQVMGMVSAGCLAPPLATAFATLVARKKWTPEEFSAGQANWIMGSFMITEGAIPFAAKDPKRIIPCLMIGSALASGIVAALQVGNSAPHGGIFVFPLLRSYLFSETGLQIGLGVAFMIGALAIGAVTAGLLINLTRTDKLQRMFARMTERASKRKKAKKQGAVPAINAFIKPNRMTARAKDYALLAALNRRNFSRRTFRIAS